MILNLCYNKKTLVVDLNCTVGRYATLGRYYEDKDEPIVLSGRKQWVLVHPVLFKSIQWKLLVVFSSFRIIIWFQAGSGRLLFDMETEEVKWTGDDDVYCVHIKYKSKGTRYKFISPVHC